MESNDGNECDGIHTYFTNVFILSTIFYSRDDSRRGKELKNLERDILILYYEVEYEKIFYWSR